MEVGDLSPQKRVRMCPQCGSSAVDFSPLEGGDARCRVCSWAGPQDRLVIMPFDHMFGGDDGVAATLVADLRGLFSNPLMATGLVRFLTRWGFVPVDDSGRADVKLATRYIAAMARGLFRAVIEERELLDKEKRNG